MTANSEDRETLKRRFLAEAGLGDARREIMGGDASTRLYERLHRRDGVSVIFMDQPPAREAPICRPDTTPAERVALGYNAASRLAAGSVAAFVAVAAYLRSLGLSAPDVLAHDVDAGLAVLEDLGDALFATLIADGEPERPLYEAAVDVQVRLQQAPPPPVLAAGAVAWPLLTYDALALKVGTDTFIDWWPRFAGLAAFAPDVVAEWDALWAPVWVRGEAGATVLTHRDFHAQNLLWLPGRSGAGRVGLLDFQDALRAHPAWDLTHLLQDARRDVAPDLEAAMLDRFLGARPTLERQGFLADYRALAASNAARILGRVFARQALLGRDQYRAYMPRTWRYLERDLESPGLEGLEGVVRPARASGGAGVSAVPTTAMVLAAGLGTRMRPLTDDRPKALVEVGGKALIDHMLDRLAEAGVERAVVNAHAFADALIAHLGRRTAGPVVVVSDERAHPRPLETGGGLRFARALLPGAPILVANIDSVWIEDAEPPAAAIRALCAGYDPRTMAARLMLARMARTSGFDGAGDFALEPDGRLSPQRVTGAATAPFNYMGVHIVDPAPIFADARDEFGFFPLKGPYWADWAAEGRLHGLVMEGDWMHVGDRAARDVAETRLARARA